MVSTLIFRDDDVYRASLKLRKMLDLFVKFETPINLAVTPRKLTKECASLLRDYMRSYSDLMFIAQHGYSHKNHGTNIKKSEFPPDRNIQKVSRDIELGRRLLTQKIGNDGALAFVPPWHSFPSKFMPILREHNFTVYSSYGGDVKEIVRSLTSVPVNLDAMRCYFPPRLRSLDSIKRSIRTHLRRRMHVGILLHHEYIRISDFKLLNKILIYTKTLNCKISKFDNAVFNPVYLRHPLGTKIPDPINFFT